MVYGGLRDGELVDGISLFGHLSLSFRYISLDFMYPHFESPVAIAYIIILRYSILNERN